MIKKIVFFDTRNTTGVNFLYSIYIVEQQGKRDVANYYFFDDAKIFQAFMVQFPEVPRFKSHITMVMGEGLRYNAEFVRSRLNLTK